MTPWSAGEETEAVARLFPTPPLPGPGVHWGEGSGVFGGGDPDPELPPPSTASSSITLSPSLPWDPWGLRYGLSSLVPAPQEPGTRGLEEIKHREPLGSATQPVAWG